MKLTRIVLAVSLAAGAAALTAAATAGAQGMPPVMRMQPLVAAQTSGSIVRYIVGPMGHVRGFALDNGAIVWLQGRGGDAFAQSVPVGQAVRVEGFAPAATPHVIHRATIYGSNGAVLAAPNPGAMAGQPMHRAPDPARRAQHLQQLAQLPTRTASGTVQMVVPGPRGRVHILLLSDGSTVYLRGPVARGVNQHGLRVGDALQVSGRGNAYPQGAALFAESVTFGDGTTVAMPAMNAPVPTP